MGNEGPRLARQRLIGVGLAGVAAAATAALATGRLDGIMEGSDWMARVRRQAAGAATDQGRLAARPRPSLQAVTTAPAAGQQRLELDAGRDGLLYLPAGYRADRPAPLALMLHGAGGNGQHGLSLLLDLADEAGLILLAPESRRQTWDVLMEGYGADVDYIDRALARTFERYAVDPARLAIGGFSDGASYALSLGITNGDLFTHVIAFSPGFMAPAAQRGDPRLYISHGTRDEVLPIDYCSRRIVPQARRAGYDLRYREFDGPHTVPPEIAREALDWFTGAGAGSGDAARPAG
jgi:phospholipase/carboxylesterase